MSAADEALGRVVASVLASRRYARVLPELVASIARRELAHRGERAAVKATKGRLHELIGASRGALDYARAARELESAAVEGRLPDACRRLLARHASTRERLPILEQLYTDVFEPLGPVASVLDLACGLNPLALPWMPLAPEARYLACDVDLALLACLERFFAVAGGARGRAFPCDLTASVPPDPVDVALVMKALPSLTRLDPGAASRLLTDLRAQHIVVSYPVATLGGRPKGMRAHYAAQLEPLTAAHNVRRLDYDTELVFVLSRAA